MNMTPQYLIDELADELASAGITRTDWQIDMAMQNTAEDWRDAEGYFVAPESIRERPIHWWAFKYEVLDRLEVDAEGRGELYDREAVTA